MQRLRIARLAALTAALPLIIVTGPAMAQTPAPQPEKKAGATPPAGSPQPAPQPAPPKNGAPAPQGDKAGDQANPGDKTGDQANPDGQPPAEPAEPTAEDLERARTAFMEGRRLFDAKDYDAAVEQFKDAYRLSKNPLLLYNIGFTHDKRKDVDLALFYYDKFMKDAGPKAAVYDEVKKRVEAINKAKENDALFGDSMGPMDEGGGRARITKFEHKPVEEVPPGYPLDITAFIPEGSGWQVTLFYRAAGEERFDSTLMKKRYSEMVGRVPKAKTTKATLQYYIEVRDKNGTIIQRSGRSASPNLVFIEKGTKPRFYPDVESEGLNDDAKLPPGGGSDTGGDTVPGLEGDYKVGPLTMSHGTFQITKYSVSGVAVGTLAMWIVSNRLAAQASVSLELDAEYSTIRDDCPSGYPCRAFSLFQKDLQQRGDRFERLSFISLGVGIVTAGLAGYLWYTELTRKEEPKSLTDSVAVVPVVSKDYVGSAATLRF